MVGYVYLVYTPYARGMRKRLQAVLLYSSTLLYVPSAPRLSTERTQVAVVRQHRKQQSHEHKDTAARGSTTKHYTNEGDDDLFRKRRRTHTCRFLPWSLSSSCFRTMYVWQYPLSNGGESPGSGGLKSPGPISLALCSPSLRSAEDRSPSLALKDASSSSFIVLADWLYYRAARRGRVTRHCDWKRGRAARTKNPTVSFSPRVFMTTPLYCMELLDCVGNRVYNKP